MDRAVDDIESFDQIAIEFVELGDLRRHDNTRRGADKMDLRSFNQPR